MLVKPDEIPGDGEPNERPTPSPTPLTETWQEGNEPPEDQPPVSQARPPASKMGGKVTVMVCPLTGMRATVNCPTKEARTYKAGTEPMEFCTFHR